MLTVKMMGRILAFVAGKNCSNQIQNLIQEQVGLVFGSLFQMKR